MCEVDSNFTDVPVDKFKEKNKQGYKSKKHHFVAEYNIHVKLWRADLSFEIVHNSHVMSTKNCFDVQWCEAATVHGPKLTEQYPGAVSDLLIEPRKRRV